MLSVSPLRGWLDFHNDGVDTFKILKLDLEVIIKDTKLQIDDFFVDFSYFINFFYFGIL